MRPSTAGENMTQVQATELQNHAVNVKPVMEKLRTAQWESKPVKLTKDEEKQIVQFYLEVVHCIV